MAARELRERYADPRLFPWELFTTKVPLDALWALYNRFTTAKAAANSGQKGRRTTIVFSEVEIEAYTRALDRVLRLREPEFVKLPIRKRVKTKKG